MRLKEGRIIIVIGDSEWGLYVPGWEGKGRREEECCGVQISKAPGGGGEHSGGL